MSEDERYEADLRGSLRTLTEATQAFGRRWSAFRSDLSGDPHVPQIQDTYVEPMLRSQTELIEALDELRRAARRFEQTSEAAEKDARRQAGPGEGR